MPDIHWIDGKQLSDDDKFLISFWIGKIKGRFERRIEPSEYYLAYSGGKDSHFLYWFIKEVMKDSKITIVGVNTSFEIPEIRRRITKNCDVVLKPIMNRWEIKSRYGIPCFSKQQDEYIHRYQNGSRTQNTMNAIMGNNAKFNLNKKAKEETLSGRLHKVSNKCCLKNKEEPMMRWAKKNGKKAIIGVRAAESGTRKAKYSTCLKANGDFTPIFDMPDKIIDLFYRVFEIDIPTCYNIVERTGCAGCPYGRYIEDELSLIPDLQRQQAIKYFKESYDVLGVDYENIQINLFY